MADKPSLTPDLTEAFNTWLDGVGLTDEARLLVAQSLMTGDYSNKGRPKYLQLYVINQQVSQVGQRNTDLTTNIHFVMDPQAQRHSSVFFQALENMRLSEELVTTAGQRPAKWSEYQDIGKLNELIQKLIVSLTPQQQTKALAVAVYFTAAMRWCVTNQYILMDASYEAGLNEPTIQMTYYHPDKRYSLIYLNWTPFPISMPDFSSYKPTLH